jgi:hypothetical protein
MPFSTPKQNRPSRETKWRPNDANDRTRLGGIRRIARGSVTMPDNFKPRRKATRARMRELDKILAATQSLLAGHMDHMFANQEAKDAMRAALKRQALELIETEFKENPGRYRELPDGRWEVFPERERKILPFDAK